MRKLVNSGTTQEELISPGPGPLPGPPQRYYSGRNYSQHYPSPDEAAGLAHCRSAVSLRPAVLAPGGTTPRTPRGGRPCSLPFGSFAQARSASPRGDDPPDPPRRPALLTAVR